MTTRKPLPGEEAMKKIGLFTEPPSPPFHAGPPLPVDIPVEKPKVTPKRGLYHDTFGDDLSIIQMALDADWAGFDQKNLATALLAGSKSINSLSTADLEMLDSLVRQFNDRGPDEKVRQEERERLLVPKAPEREEPEGGSDQDVQSEDESEMPAGDNPYHPDGYGWLGEEGGGE